MTKQKKLKLRIPKWLAITLLTLGILFLLGGIVGHTDMVIIGCILTTLSIIGSVRDWKLPKWLSITLLVLGLVFLLGDTIGTIIGIVFIVLGIIGFLGNRKPKVTQAKSATSIAAPTIQHRPAQQLVTPKSSSSTPPKKSKSPLAIARDTVFLIIFAPIALIIVVVWFVVATDYRPESNNEQLSEQQENDTQKTVDEINQIANNLSAAVDKYAPIYCQNRTEFRMKNDQNLASNGWPTFDGTRAWNAEECRTIISKLLDVTTEERVAQISEGRKIGVGMQDVEVIYSIGYPDDVNSTTNQWGTNEQWIYGNPIYGANYVYLDNGTVTSYQQ